jgi:hypothetical protein
MLKKLILPYSPVCDAWIYKTKIPATVWQGFFLCGVWFYNRVKWGGLVVHA